MMEMLTFLVLPMDIANPYRLLRVWYIYIERERHMSSFWHHILAISPAVCQNGSSRFTGWAIIEELSIRQRLHTFLISWGQTENACKTLLCQFIVMIWVLVCNNMYRYQHHFGLFYRNPTILEMVSMLPANGSTWENFCFYWNTMTGNNSITDVSLLRQNVKIKCKEYFSYHFPHWPIRV